MGKQKTNTGFQNTKSLKTELAVFDNLSENAIQINESKARLIYNKHINATSGGQTLTFFGLFITCLITVLTSDFKDVLNISNSSYVLYALFLICTVTFGIVTIVLFIKWIIDKSHLNADTFIQELKGEV